MADTNRIHDIEKAIYEGMINTPFTAVPFTEIKDEQGQPRQMADLTQNLKVNMGIERIPFNSITKLTNEFGPAGEIIYELPNKDARIRFVGSWSSTEPGRGNPIALLNGDGFLEITFYGTGLNVLDSINVAGVDIRATIDGSVEGSNLYPSSISNIIQGRNYKSNMVIPIVSNLSLGWHTIKIRSNNTFSFYLLGVEIINESTQLIINPGQPFQGGFAAKLDTQTLLDFKPTSIVGTKGGRVKTYLDANGALAQVSTEVDSTALFLTNATHINEEIINIINFRAFGKNRGDDFSTLSTSSSDRAFTLADGTTTLVGNNVLVPTAVQSKGVGFNNAIGDFLTLTFVGTGLDLIMHRDSIAGTLTLNVDVDGNNIGTIVDTQLPQNSEEGVKIKVCSGLSYGTHTVKVAIGASGSVNLVISNFVIYQPKEPILPDNAIVLADYNVIANFIANTTANINVTSIGTIRKSAARELIYIGAWVYNAPDIGRMNGLDVRTTTIGASVQYTFYGTGFDMRMSSSASQNITIDIDGSTDHSSLTTSIYSNAAATFTAATGILTGEFLDAGAIVSGLTKGLHTVTITQNTTNSFLLGGFDIIMSTHINNIKVGSLSMNDLRQNAQTEDSAKQIDLSKAKAWIQYDHVANKVLNSYNISSVLDTGTGSANVYFKIPFKDDKYICLGSARKDGGSNIALVVFPDIGISGDTRINPGWTQVEIRSASNALIDRTWYVVFFGELEDEENLDLKDL